MKRLNFRLQNKYESKERYFWTKWTEENMVLRGYLHPLSTVSDAGVIGEVGSDAFYTFRLSCVGSIEKKEKINITGSLEMTYGFRARERKGESWAQTTGQAQ